MGVCNLDNFMREHLKNGVRTISIEEELKKWQNHSDEKSGDSRRPILVFDVMALSTLLSHDKQEVLCGGRHQMYAKTLDRLFTRLSTKAELVFFLDGSIKETKFPTWAKRQNEKYHRSLQVLDLVYQGVELETIVSEHGSQVYTNTLLSAIEAACKRHGQLHYTMNLECDQELAQFASANKRVLAVLSNDTDFLIFGGHWRLFTINDLELDSLKTLEMDRQKLRKYLNLNDVEMALFATLAGNDIVPYTELNTFHQQFQYKHSRRFKESANYIKDLRNFDGDFYSFIQFLSIKVHGNVNENNTVRLMNSINSYSLDIRADSSKVNLTSEEIHPHNSFIINILNQSPINLSLVFFDLREEDFLSYYELAVPMLERQAGIVLANTSNPDALITIYTKKYHDYPHLKHYAVATFPPFQVPSFMQLHSEILELDRTRFDLLKWSISWRKLKNFDVHKIAPNYLIDVLTLVFLHEHWILTSREAAFILWTIIEVENGAIPEDIKPPKVLDPRAFRLAFLYVKIFANIVRSIEVCGLKIKYCKALNFDGVFFHKKYQLLSEQNVDFFEFLRELEWFDKTLFMTV